MTANYTLNVRNESTESGTFAIYQQDPNVNSPNTLTLAWLSAKAHPTTTISFTWNTQMSFVWRRDIHAGETGQTWDAELVDQNEVTFTKDDGAYTFSDQRSSQGNVGSFMIVQDGTVVSHEAFVGMGMSGSPTFMIPSEPNLQATFTPAPKYYLMFSDVKAGDVMDAGILKTGQTDGKVFEVRFPNGKLESSVVYQGDGKWNVVS